MAIRRGPLGLGYSDPVEDRGRRDEEKVDATGVHARNDRVEHNCMRRSPVLENIRVKWMVMDGGVVGPGGGSGGCERRLAQWTKPGDTMMRVAGLYTKGYT